MMPWVKIVMLLMLTAALTLAGCGQEQPTDIEPLSDSRTESNLLMEGMLEDIESAMKNPPRGTLQIEMIFNQGGARPAPALETPLSAWVEENKGVYLLEVEANYDSRGYRTSRWHDVNAKTAKLEIVPASESPMANNGILQLRNSPAMMIWDSNSTLLRRYALIGVTMEPTTGGFQQPVVQLPLLACVKFSHGELNAFSMIVIGSGERLVLSAISAYPGYNATGWVRKIEE